jgi:branched-subunit amino acid ABC-type transport system permease component
MNAKVLFYTVLAWLGSCAFLGLVFGGFRAVPGALAAGLVFGIPMIMGSGIRRGLR